MSEIPTNSQQIILASSSSTRKNDLKKHFKYFTSIKHAADELKIKRDNQHLNYRDLVLLLAKMKAESIMKKYPKDIIIASDQILICENTVINKPLSIKQAKENLKFIIGKKHQLISAIYVVHNQNVYFKEVSEAILFFKTITEEQLDIYLNENNETALTTVGSYKIEDNEKYKFIKIISGDLETIKGFPLKNFLEKMEKR